MRIDGLLRASATRTPDAVALVDYDGTPWRYAELLQASEKIALRLAAQGVQPNDRVLLVTENCAALCAYIFACSIAGAWAVPVNARMTAPELDRIIDHAKPRIGVFFEDVSDDAGQHAERWNASGSPAIAELGPSDPAQDAGVGVLLYTTGTTGTPKGVMLTHDNLVFAGKTSVNTRSLVASDVIYGALPLTHVFGMASMLMASVHIGATIRLEARFAPAKLYQALTDGVTVLPAVPQMHALLMQYTSEKGITRMSGGTLRYVSSGAAPLDVVWKRKAEAFYGIALQNGYGMTETTAGVCTTQNTMGDPDISVGP
ncbi:MAG: class I adenylate-forming enzyme family protein, partial [Paracoccaceae bacterium]